MRTVRRIYISLVALLSAEVVIWGVITLLRTLFNPQPLGGATGILSGGLAAVLVGLPIFLLHWSLAQRDAHLNTEERDSRVRALFLYALRFSLLVPVVQSAIALLNRLLLVILSPGAGMDPMVGSGQTAVDNLVALAINLIALAYFERVLRADWRSDTNHESLREVRRLFRYLWMLYTLALLVLGMVQVIRFMIYPSLNEYGFPLAGWLALALGGAPLWASIWRVIQASLDEPGERHSLLRRVVLYGLTLTGLLVALVAGGNLLAALLRLLLGEDLSAGELLARNSGALSALLPFVVMWAYFGRELNAHIAAEPDEVQRAGLARTLRVILALAGNVATVGGLLALLYGLAELAFNRFSGLPGVRGQLAGGLAALIVGVPLWRQAWLPEQAEARALSVPGSQSRRSTLRKGYLYLVIFVAVIGGMTAAGMLLFLIISRLLGDAQPAFAVSLARRAASLAVAVIWLVYHLQVLRADGSAADARHSAFRVLVLQPEGSSLGDEMEEALQRVAPHIPLAVHNVDAGMPGEDLSSARAVVLPAGLAMQPPEAWRLWLAQFRGKKVVVPENMTGVVWAGQPDWTSAAAAQETARALRQLAEGQTVRPNLPAGPWAVAGYVLAALFALQVLAVLVGILLSTVLN